MYPVDWIMSGHTSQALFLEKDGEEYDEEEMEEMNELFDEDGHITFETFFALFSDDCDDDDEEEE